MGGVGWVMIGPETEHAVDASGGGRAEAGERGEVEMPTPFMIHSPSVPVKKVKWNGAKR
jgi:hypothetical protein